MEQSNLDSMYAAYREEFENVYTIYNEFGFANYSIESCEGSELEIYIQEVYVKPEHRGFKIAAKLTNNCITAAEVMYDQKVTKLYTSIGIGGNTVDKSIRAITAYGFQLFKSNETIIYFKKEIK